MASYPNSVKSFTSRSAGQTIASAHVNDLQDEVNAIEAGLLNGTAPLNSSNSTVVLLSVSGGQIAFPANQNGSADGNTLDDYEEAGYTPTVTNSSVDDGAINGYYVKIGSQVTGTVKYTVGAGSSFNSSAVSFSLPFTAHALPSFIAWGSALDNGVNSYPLQADIAASSNTAQLTCFRGPSTSGYLIRQFVNSTAPFAPGTGDVYTVNFTYRASS